MLAFPLITSKPFLCARTGHVRGCCPSVPAISSKRQRRFMLINRRTVVEIIILLKTARRAVHSGGGREGPIIVRLKESMLSERLTEGRGSIVMAGTGERDISAKQGNLETEVGVEKVVVCA
ncbi:hypothetical protein PILCRDRAFT_597692 [Piloderma croceum F 1598]|uniref:Uncharacterized protein n=1 Tax=Piloderma croceum (strain F 1598) TaxID=765440 RepID=A0A0C3BLI5_PILCF|nr:hypothetical protein PILCRDRAFT_597692 [Piloderma croceum F 1598]